LWVAASVFWRLSFLLTFVLLLLALLLVCSTIAILVSGSLTTDRTGVFATSTTTSDSLTGGGVIDLMFLLAFSAFGDEFIFFAEEQEETDESLFAPIERDFVRLRWLWLFKMMVFLFRFSIMVRRLLNLLVCAVVCCLTPLV